MLNISPAYLPRRPQDSKYHQRVEDTLEEFEQVYDERLTTKYGFFLAYEKQVIYRYLDCGILYNGFDRVICKVCGHEYLLAFSCKRRYFCPSCHQNRVMEFEERLCEESSRPSPTHTLSFVPRRSCGATSSAIEYFSPN